MEIDKDMMRALEADAAMLEAIGASHNLAFVSGPSGMRLTDAAAGHWEVYDVHGNVLAENLTLDEADAMLFG